MKRKKIHFIGIGGIGMSALARLYKARGIWVSGSDLARSEITDALRQESIHVEIGPHKKSRITKDIQEVICTAAAPEDNPELKEARRRHIQTRTYAQALGEASKEYKTIAIAGTHGKSTTTALTALALIAGGINPTVVVGTKLREFGDSNLRLGRSSRSADLALGRSGRRPGSAKGQSDWLVLEADEYRLHFHNYSPAIAVALNIDFEHPDFFKNFRQTKAAFLDFLKNIKPNGVAVLNHDDKAIRETAKKLKRLRPGIKIIWFSMRDPEAAKIQKVLRVPGRHNASNALAAYRVARQFKIPKRKILKSLASYRGAWRRFDYQGIFIPRAGQGGAKVFADYAHHPTEIRATIQGASAKFPKSRIVCAFQPHHYERTRALFKEFTQAFDKADLVFLLDIYQVAGRERSRKSNGISSKILAAAISRRGTSAKYVRETELPQTLAAELRPGDVLLMMGAGSIWEMTKRMMAEGTKDAKGAKESKSLTFQP